MALTPVTAHTQRARLRAGRQAVGRPAVEIGIRGGYDFDVTAPSAGVQLRLPIGPTAELVPSGDYYFTGSQTAWQANLDLAVRTGFLQVVYAGVGAALAHRSFVTDEVMLPEDTKLALNLFAGASVPRFFPGRWRPYLETRWTVASGYDSQFVALIGLNVRLGSARR
jgi:hypothetical protein